MCRPSERSRPERHMEEDMTIELRPSVVLAIILALALFG